MDTGKLESQLLEDIVFKHLTYKRPEVLSRPGIGKDCAVVDFGEYDCIMSTDPITGAANEIGKLAIHISCNDIATNGIEPLGILLAVMLPEGITESEIDEMMRQAGEESERLGIEIIGGHTEITNAVTKPIIVSTAIGRKAKDNHTAKSNAQPGDLILMSKSAGLEGTAIIASDFKDKITGILDDQDIQEAKSMFEKLSVVKEGIAGGKAGAISMHDITEGGVLGAVWEMCQVAGYGAEIFYDQIPIAESTKKVCSHFGLDPLKLISSGSMLIIISKENSEMLIDDLKRQNIDISIIGEIIDEGIYLIQDNAKKEIDPPLSDELYKVL